MRGLVLGLLLVAGGGAWAGEGLGPGLYCLKTIRPQTDCLWFTKAACEAFRAPYHSVSYPCTLNPDLASVEGEFCAVSEAGRSCIYPDLASCEKVALQTGSTCEARKTPRNS